MKLDTFSTMFVDRTNDEKLVEDLKAKEQELAHLVGFKTKIIEKNGLKLEQILVQRDPWKGWDCRRVDCVVCLQKPQHNTKADCNRESTTYRATCINCKQNTPEQTVNEDESDVNIAEYIGETCKSLYVRGGKHEENYRLMNPESFMLRHHMEAHKDLMLGDVRFHFEVVKHHETCFRRQIHEAVEIKLSTTSNRTTLNSKLEFNRSILPNLCDMEPTQAEKDNDKKTVDRIKKMKEK